jgi:hypothetical protein
MEAYLFNWESIIYLLFLALYLASILLSFVIDYHGVVLSLGPDLAISSLLLSDFRHMAKNKFNG